MVFSVSTVHKAEQIVERCRRQPRKTQKNQKHVDEVWGTKGKVDVMIPRLIDDYNHWMGGVDLCDQHISYHHPDVRCQQSWVPMFIQILSVIRSNSYIIHKTYFEKKALAHKDFTMEIIHTLMNRALGEDGGTDASPLTMASSFRTPPSKKALQVNLMKREMENKKNQQKERHKQIRLSVYTDLDKAFPLRKDLPLTLHKQVSDGPGVRARCVYCSWQYNHTDKAKRGEWTKVVKRTSMVCYHCNTFLCVKHFDIFHTCSGMPPP